MPSGFEYAGTQSTEQSSTRSTFNWETFIPAVMGSTTTMISAIKGQSYQSGPTGYGGGQFGSPSPVYSQGFNVGGGASLIGGISPTTLLLIGGVVLIVMMGRRR